MEESRLARPGDVPVLRALWRAAIDDLAGRRGGALLVGRLSGDDLDREIERYVGDPDRLAVLGLLDAVPLGFAAARREGGRGPRLGVVDAIFVDADARAVGLGEAMLERVVDWCARLGCIGVDAPALPGSRSAKAFFEDQGFVARLLIMHHPLDGGER